MKLYFRKTGEGFPLIILHGLFGSGDNWFSLSNLFGEDYTVYTPDARNHGRSAHTEITSYELMADDLLELADSEGLKKFHLLGHSMGGKTAMQFACLHNGLVDKLVISDIGPKHYPIHHQEILSILNSPGNQKFESRKEAESKLQNSLPEYIVKFLAKNLVRDEQGIYIWRFNLKGITSNIEKIGSSQLHLPAFQNPVLFLKGEHSEYIVDSDLNNIPLLFPNSEMQVVANAGHWIHADNPEAFMNVVKGFLER